MSATMLDEVSGALEDGIAQEARSRFCVFDESRAIQKFGLTQFALILLNFLMDCSQMFTQRRRLSKIFLVQIAIVATLTVVRVDYVLSEVAMSSESLHTKIAIKSPSVNSLSHSSHENFTLSCSAFTWTRMLSRLAKSFPHPLSHGARTFLCTDSTCRSSWCFKAKLLSHPSHSQRNFFSLVDLGPGSFFAGIFNFFGDLIFRFLAGGGDLTISDFSVSFCAIEVFDGDWGGVSKISASSVGCWCCCW